MHFPLEVFSAVSASNPWTYIVFGAIGYAFGSRWKWPDSVIPESWPVSSISGS